MQRRAVSHYCQKCRAANPLGQEFCLRCGTKLMIVVHPPSSRVDAIETTPHEEHLLERLTVLENTLAKFAERLEEGLNHLLRQSETTYVNHSLVKSLIEVLQERGVLDSEGLEHKWRTECDKLKTEPEKPRRSTRKQKRPTTPSKD
jgi:hypothetical protein